MDLPRILLDALNDSVTSGTFVDTKFYVFSRKEASGRVGSPRALYCNSRVLNTVPYFSSCEYPGHSDITRLIALLQSVLGCLLGRTIEGRQRGIPHRLLHH